MQRALTLLITTFIFSFLWACSSVSEQPWTSMVPAESSFLIIPKENVSITNISDTRYASILEDITASSSQQIASFDPGEPLSQNYYTIKGNTIHKLEAKNGTVLYASQVHDWLVFSSSSLAVESSIRSYLGLTSTMEIPTDASPGQLIMNTPNLDDWVEQFLNVNLRPSVTKSFSGSKSASLLFTSAGDSLNSPVNLAGKIT